MAALVLIATGTYALAWGLVRGYLSARAALVPLTGGGEPTRAFIEASKPLYARARFRTSMRCGAVAALWLVVALYGLFLTTMGVGALR